MALSTPHPIMKKKEAVGKISNEIQISFSERSLHFRNSEDATEQATAGHKMMN